MTIFVFLRRKVPLSEGSVEADGSLMCGYHGWRWNGDGKAIAIPQVPTYSTLGYFCILRVSLVVKWDALASFPHQHISSMLS